VTKVDFIYFEAGGGHRSAATALKAVAEQQGRPWEVRLVNLQEVLDSLDVFRKLTGIRLEDIYNRMLASGWTIGSKYGLRFMHGVIRLYHGPTVRLLERYWKDTRPDMVVSLVPNFNRAMCQSLEQVLPGTPYVTVLTDFADYPPHFWIERQRQWVICGTAKAVEQARSLGHAEERIFRTSGMILRPEFYEKVTVDRAEAHRRDDRRKLGLDPDRPTGLVLFGGHGSRVMLEIARSLEDRQLIFICGRNEALAARLRALPSKAARFVEGFTSEVPHYMRMADYFVGKPGPGSISEAVAMGLPVIVERNVWTLVQERYNAEWVLERGAGLVLPNFHDIRGAVERMERELKQFQTAVARIENRAVFEIPDMLQQVLGRRTEKTQAVSTP
jgi:UDP-N-acetylglucosamine:LPS N-acetylglucosamine transferase